MKVDLVETRLPCGGRIELRFYSVPPAGSVDEKTVVCMPEVHCTKSYAKAKRCAWVERLRKFYAGAAALDEGLVHGDGDSAVVEAEVDYGDGTVRHVRYGEDSGIVICGADIFQDRQLMAASFEERDDFFECCDHVDAEHGGIIAFLKRLFAMRKKEKIQ